MPRDGSGIYHRPVGTDAVTDTTIESTKYNINVQDVEQDLNTPRPIVAGGTGATTAAGALAALGGEQAKQIITNYDANTFVAGSFYSASTATNPPVSGHAFSGICYVTDASNMFIEARDQDDSVHPGRLYARQLKGGVWSGWAQDVASSGPSSSAGPWLFSNILTFPPNNGQVRFNNATQSAATHVYISHMTNTGTDLTAVLPSLIAANGKMFVQDTSVAANYISFNITSVSFTSGDADVTVTFSDAGSPIASGAATSLTFQSPAGATMFVRYDAAQTLSSAQKTQAVSNINAVNKSGDTMTGALSITDATASTSPTTGALKVTGGVGVGGDINSAGSVTATGVNGGLELGSLSAVGNSYVDFHSSGNVNDYDARIIATGGSATVGAGSLGVNAAGGVTFTGPIGTNGGNVYSNGGSAPQIALQVSGVQKGVMWMTGGNFNFQNQSSADPVSVAIVADNHMQLGRGFAGRQGINGGGWGSTHNFYWTSSAIQAWVDNVNVGTLAFTSDYRIKRDVLDLPGMWDTVKALRPIKYTQRAFTPPSQIEANAKARSDAKAAAQKAKDAGEESPPDPIIPSEPMFVADNVERWGFVAHELQETLIMDAATGVKDSPDTVQSPNPWTVIAALTRALQEAMARIEALEAAR